MFINQNKKAMKKLMFLTLTLAFTAFLFTSCGDKSKKDKSSESTSTMETSSESSSEMSSSKEEKDMGTNDEASNTIHLTGNDQMQYNKTSLKVKAGEPITLTMKSIGKLPPKAMSHDVVVLKAESDVKAFGKAATAKGSLEKMDQSKQDEILAKTKMLGAGEKDEITFTLDDPGEYPFVCTFPGHYVSMHGTITAK